MPPESQFSAMANSIPNYAQLLQFLVHPFLDSPEAFAIHCEELGSNKRVWIRLAFAEEDKGKVFGRGGRNIQSIRNVLATAASSAHQSVHLEIYGSDDSSSHREQKRSSRPAPPKRSSTDKPMPKPRSR